MKLEAAVNSLAAKMAAHEFGVLQFSGGKDSLACLELVRPWLDRILVLWCNAGDEIPEKRELMERVRASVPHFRELRGDAAGQQEREGWPVDMLPELCTAFGRSTNPDSVATKLRMRHECCASNLWAPTLAEMKRINATLIIRGARGDDRLRVDHMHDGIVVEGVTYSMPLFDWTAKEVFEYLTACGVELPADYGYSTHSLDCMHCTAYLSENPGKLRYLRERYPAAAKELERRLIAIESVQRKHFDDLQSLLRQAESH